MFKTKIREREGKCFPFLFFFQKTSGEKKRAVSWPFLKALQATANACSSVFQNMLFFWRLQDAEETGPCLGLFHKHIMHSSSCLHWEPFPFFSSRIAADLLCSPCPAPTLSPLPSEGIGQHAALRSSTQQSGSTREKLIFHHQVLLLFQQLQLNHLPITTLPVWQHPPIGAFSKILLSRLMYHKDKRHSLTLTSRLRTSPTELKLQTTFCKESCLGSRPPHLQLSCSIAPHHHTEFVQPQLQAASSWLGSGNRWPSSDVLCRRGC